MKPGEWVDPYSIDHDDAQGPMHRFDPAHAPVRMIAVVAFMVLLGFAVAAANLGERTLLQDANTREKSRDRNMISIDGELRRMASALNGIKLEISTLVPRARARPHPTLPPKP